MYIQFESESLFEALMDATILKIRMGSHLYGCDTETSDTDYLCIYREGLENQSSFMWEHHGYQCKKEGVDYNFISIQSFIRNLINGDSPHHFEVLYSNEFESSSSLKWLVNYRNDFMNYNLIRAYLGFAKRDLKDYHRLGKDSPDGWKKAFHFMRGVSAAEMLCRKKYTNDNTSIKYIKLGESEYLDKLIKADTDSMEMLRILLNLSLSSKTIHRYMNPKALRAIDFELMSMCAKESYRSKQPTFINYIDLPYNALEHGVIY